MPTSGYVSLLWSVGKQRELNREEIAALENEMKLRADEYVEIADNILAWAANVEPRNDYEHNLKIALAGDSVTGKTFGLVVSACAAYDKQQAVIADRKERAEREAEQAAASFHFGEAGERYRAVTVSVEKTIGMPDRGYGPSTLYVLRTDDGALLKWFTGSGPRHNGKAIERGDKFAADFTVKKHEEYRGAAQTVVTRVKAVA